MTTVTWSWGRANLCVRTHLPAGAGHKGQVPKHSSKKPPHCLTKPWPTLPLLKHPRKPVCDSTHPPAPTGCRRQRVKLVIAGPSKLRPHAPPPPLVLPQSRLSNEKRHCPIHATMLVLAMPCAQQRYLTSREAALPGNMHTPSQGKATTINCIQEHRPISNQPSNKTPQKHARKLQTLDNPAAVHNATQWTPQMLKQHWAGIRSTPCRSDPDQAQSEGALWFTQQTYSHNCGSSSGS